MFLKYNLAVKVSVLTDHKKSDMNGGLVCFAEPTNPQMDIFTCRNSTGSVAVPLWILHIRSEMYCCCVILLLLHLSPLNPFLFTNTIKCLKYKGYSESFIMVFFFFFFYSDGFIGEDSLLLEEELVLSDDIAFVYCQEMGLFRPALRNQNCNTLIFFFIFMLEIVKPQSGCVFCWNMSSVQSHAALQIIFHMYNL